MDVNEFAVLIGTLKEIKSIVSSPPPPPNQWMPVIAAIGGALVGGLAPLVTSMVTEWYKRLYERSNARNALAAEVSALLNIIKARNYIERLSEIAESMKKSEIAEASKPFADQLTQAARQSRRVVIHVPAHYSRVYQSYVPRLGALQPEFAANLIHFHQLVDAIVQDFQPGGLAETGHATSAMLLQNAEMLRAAVSAGDKVTRAAGLSADSKATGPTHDEVGDS